MKRILVATDGSEHSDKTIKSGDDRRFNFDCDFYSRVDSEINIEYMEVGGNETLTANGEIRADFNYYDY